MAFANTSYTDILATTIESRSKKVAEILSKARDHYAAGIDEIDKALQALGE